MEKSRIGFMRKAVESDNLSPLARKLLTECVKAIEQLKIDKMTVKWLLLRLREQKEVAENWLEEKQKTINDLREQLEQEGLRPVGEEQQLVFPESGYKPCVNPLCDRKTKAAILYCCHGCKLAHQRHHEDEPLVHSGLCDQNQKDAAHDEQR